MQGVSCINGRLCCVLRANLSLCRDDGVFDATYLFPGSCFSPLLCTSFHLFLLHHYWSLIMPEGYVALPQDNDPGQTSQPKSLIDRAKQWWHHQNNEERAPLLDRKRMTLQPPKRKTIKVIIVTVLILLALLVLGVVLALWIDKDDNNQGKQWKWTSDQRIIKQTNT